MTYQGKVPSTVRGVMLGVAMVVLIGAQSGCASHGVPGGTTFTPKPSSADFEITFDPGQPVDSAVKVEPNEGDAWLETVLSTATDKNRIVWTSDRDFAIKFVSIDDQTQPGKRLGNEKNGWNKAGPKEGGGYILELRLDQGKGKTKKEIRGVKYLVKSPSDCDAKNPGPNCMVLDPVIIVRF